MESPSQKRQAINHVVERGKATTTEACRALDLQRSTYFRSSTARHEGQEIERSIVSLNEDHSRYGYRRITIMARRKAAFINATLVS